MRTAHRVLSCVVLLFSAPLLADEPKETAGGPSERRFQVRGRVVDEADQPVSGAEVESIGNQKAPSAFTGADGGFLLELPRRPPQFLMLRALKSAGSLQAFAWYGLDQTFDWRGLEDGKLPAEIKLVLRPAKVISVHVIDGRRQAAANAHVFVAAPWYHKADEATTDDQGQAVLRAPADAPLSSVVGMKPGVGLDYFLYRGKETPSSDPYHLSGDQPEPVTLVLDGARRVTVKAVDERGQPLAGVSVDAWYFERPKKGGHLNTTGFSDFRRKTGQDGEAIFDALPADCVKNILFPSTLEGYFTPDRATLEPGKEAAEITATLVKLLPVRGRVTYADGRPAAGAAVQAAGDGYHWQRFRGQVQADEEGRFELGVYPDQFYLFAASLNDLATPLAQRVIFKKAPDEEIRLVLTKGTRIHGRLTIDQDQRPWAGQHLVLYRHADDDYKLLPDDEKLKDPAGRSGRRGGGRIINPILGASTSTGEQGEFEFFSGPGKCYIVPPAGVEAPRFVLNGEPEWGLELHADRPSRERFAGRVVLQSDAQTGVAEARVSGFALNSIEDPGGLQATSDAQGLFEADRRTVAILLYAKNEAGTLAGMARIGPDDRSAEIAVAPAASAHGRLLDVTTNEPLRNMQVQFGVAWEGPRTGQECGGSIRTDEHGKFAVAGLVPGWKYEFAAIREQIRSGLAIGRLENLTRLTFDDPQDVDLGEFEIDPSGNAKLQSARAPAASSSPRPKLYDATVDGNEQIAVALKAAKAERKHVLLQFGANWCGWCHALSDCFKQNEAVAAALREDYIIALIDVDRVDGKQHNSDVVEQYGNPTQHGLPALVVLDADGKQLKTKDTDELERDGRHDPEKVLAFLNRWKPERGAGAKGAD